MLVWSEHVSMETLALLCLNINSQSCWHGRRPLVMLFHKNYYTVIISKGFCRSISEWALQITTVSLAVAIIDWEETPPFKQLCSQMKREVGDHFLKLSPRGTSERRWCRLSFKPPGLFCNGSQNLLGQTNHPRSISFSFTLLVSLCFFSPGLLTCSSCFFVLLILSLLCPSLLLLLLLFRLIPPGDCNCSNSFTLGLQTSLSVHGLYVQYSAI